MLPSNQELEKVVLVDERNNILGEALKSEVHTNDTPLHRGFSVFLFSDDKLLLQQRASTKQTWPLVWSNSCCGHPMLNESNENAALRRLNYELGYQPNQIKDLKIVISNYRYRYQRDGIVENEICPILVAKTKHQPSLNPDEVQATKWILWTEFLKIAKKKPKEFSEWSLEEATLIKNLL